MTPAELTAIQDRLDKATPGPWESHFWHHAGYTVDAVDAGGLTVGRVCYLSDDGYRKSNADLIAHAPADLAALLAEVKRLREAQSLNSSTVNPKE